MNTSRYTLFRSFFPVNGNQCGALHGTPLHYTALAFLTLHSPLHCTAFLHCTALPFLGYCISTKQARCPLVAKKAYSGLTVPEEKGQVWGEVGWEATESCKFPFLFCIPPSLARSPCPLPGVCGARNGPADTGIFVFYQQKHVTSLAAEGSLAGPLCPSPATPGQPRGREVIALSHLGHPGHLPSWPPRPPRPPAQQAT